MEATVAFGLEVGAVAALLLEEAPESWELAVPPPLLVPAAPPLVPLVPLLPLLPEPD
jgi:hypothetical protein